MESRQPPRTSRAEQHATDNALLSLPDDALLAVLAYLSPRELFNCRVVSRRLRDMCLHPALWKNVKLKKRGMIRAALALAPCLASIISGHAFDVSLNVLASQVLSTTCVVDELSCSVSGEDNGDILYAVSIFLKLSALGGLRKLDLFFGYYSEDTPWDTPLLLKAAYNLSNLQTLKVKIGRPLPASCCDFEVRPSLIHLVYSSSMNDPFLELLLRAHAATLQRVELDCIKDTPVALLAKMHGLRYLRCRLSNDLIQLVAIPNLRVLKLYVADSEDEPTAFPQGATDFLSLASKLRRVEFLVSSGSIPFAYLLALSRSPSARILAALGVQSLVPAGVLIGAEVVQLLTSVPAKFPSLRYLSLDAVPSDELLRAVSPTSLPCLTTLNVSAPDDTTCLHSWLHYPAVQDLLVRNTALHLCVQSFKITSQECSCLWCRWGCHSLLKGRKYWEFSFSSHSRRAGCPVNCFQVVHPVIF